MNTNENYSESESELLSDSPDDDASEEIEKVKQGEKSTEYYQTIQESLEWNNITSFIKSNAKYLGLIQ